jgi:signal transduction histidine kinase
MRKQAVTVSLLLVALLAVGGCQGRSSGVSDERNVVKLVRSAAAQVVSKGEAAFGDFRTRGGAWRHDDFYIFVLDLKGNMLVHPQPEMEGRNLIYLEDLDRKPIIRALIKAAVASPSGEGWCDYRWSQPEKYFPLNKRTFVKSAVTPRGKKYVVGCGYYLKH